MECAVGNMAKGRIRGATSDHPQRAVRIVADGLKHSPFQLEVRSDNAIFQMNKFGAPDYPEPTRVVGEHITRAFERNASW